MDGEIIVATKKPTKNAKRTTPAGGEDGSDTSRKSSAYGDALLEMMQRLMEQVAELKREGQEQQATIQKLQHEHQGSQQQSQAAIQELHRMLLERQRQNEEIQRQIEETRRKLQDTERQMKEVREQLEDIKNCPGMTLAGSSPRTTYAEAARTPPTSQADNVRTLSSTSRTPSTFTDTLFCTIDASRVEGAEKSNVTAGTVRSAVEKEMRVRKGDGSWRCKAVTIDARHTSRVKIFCRNEEEHNMVKQAAEVATLAMARGVRILRDELYPIKVDNVNRTAVLDESGVVRPGAAEAFGQENETTVAKVSWLSRKDVPKAYGSMVVYLTKAADAQKVLEEGYFHAGGESGRTAIFERRHRPEVCYNCQEVGHKAFKCTKPRRCARCALEGHRHDTCREEVPRCVPCGGPHESFSRNCPRLYPGLHE